MYLVLFSTKTGAKRCNSNLQFVAGDRLGQWRIATRSETLHVYKFLYIIF